MGEKITRPIVRDWTRETLCVEVVNAEGERFYFEVGPDADPNAIPSRPTDAYNKQNQGRIMTVQLPLL